ncbi:MAG: hypothetical protein ACREKL_02395 [Chthoniobacterales bacterium]
MKSLLLVAAISVVAFAVAAEKSSKGSLPEVKGRFTSQTTFVLGTEKPDVTTLSMSVRASKSQKKLKVRMAGTADPSDTPVPVDLSLKFTDRGDNKGKVTSNSLMMGYYGAIKTAPATYRKKGSTLVFKLKAVAGSNILNTPIAGSVTYRCKFNRKKLSIVGIGNLNILPAGTPFLYTASIFGTALK